MISVAIAAVQALSQVRTGWAHGEPVITIDPTVAAAGSQITVTGAEVELGEVFAITLEGIGGLIPLGEATVTGEGEDGAFTATFTLPTDLAPGSYTVRAVTEAGEAATTDLTVTATANNASAGPAMVMDEASGELHAIDRSKPVSQIIAVAAAIALSAVAGFVLIRNSR